MLRILFAGTPEFARVALEAIADSTHRVCAVLTQPDRPAGRGRKHASSPVKLFAQARGFPVLQPTTLKDPEVIQLLVGFGADVMVVAAYGMLLPPGVLALPPLGCINIHASLLPRWRGAAPIQRAIMAGDTQTGISIMQMDAGLDTGPVLMTRACPIEAADTAGTLHDKLAILGAQAVVAALSQLETGTLVATPQPSDGVTYARKITKEESFLAFASASAMLAREVRGLHPGPVARTRWRGEPLLIHRASVGSPCPGVSPGEVVRVSSSGLQVACGDENCLNIEELQVPGGKRMPVSEFLRARQFDIGERLG